MQNIRVAQAEDASAMLGIYAPFILHTACMFEAVVPTEQAFAERVTAYLQTYPWLVFEVDGTIAGYAYAGKHRERAAYQWCVESSVYVHPDFRKRGIALTLSEALFKILTHQGFRNIYAAITLPNDQSVALHEKLGFAWFADFRNIGYKADKWNTVGWWQKQVNDFCNVPSSPTKFSDLKPAEIEGLLNKSGS